VTLPPTGRTTLRETLLASALRLCALAQPNGKLVGRNAEPYTERQLSTALDKSRSTARAILHWFEDAGWLSRRSAANKRDADERELIIPASAVVAPPGWPLVEVVGQRSSSSVSPRSEAVVGQRSNTGVSPRDNASSSPVVGQSSAGRGLINEGSWANPSDFVGSRPSSSVSPLPGYPDTRTPGTRIDAFGISLGEQVAERASTRAHDIERTFGTTLRSCQYFRGKARERWEFHVPDLIVELVSRNDLSESTIRRRAREFFCNAYWVSLGDSSQARHLREYMLKPSEGDGGAP
jgi:hypothetical protein